jgi:hypothetical protein
MSFFSHLNPEPYVLSAYAISRAIVSFNAMAAFG